MTAHTDNVVERPADLTASWLTDPGQRDHLWALRDWGMDWLRSAATIDLLGHAPLRLVAEDGRVSQFPRAWATVSTASGRAGVRWLEWNRNLPGA